MNIGIINHESAISFITAGRSIFTLKNSKTENRFTYNISISTTFPSTRPLTVPESIETGLGPDCARKLYKK